MSSTGSLYTGQSSASFTSATAKKLLASRQLKQQAKLDVKQKLEPQAEALYTLIDRRRAQVLEDLANLPIGLNVTEERLTARLEAIQMHLKFIDSFKQSVTMIMRGEQHG